MELMGVQMCQVLDVRSGMEEVLVHFKTCKQEQLVLLEGRNYLMQILGLTEV